jgi:hypothetical protein
MERELGISYPTVRGRVDSLVRALGFGDQPAGMADDELDDEIAAQAEGDIGDEAEAAERRDILERLARKEIGAEEAAEKLRALGGAR